MKKTEGPIKGESFKKVGAGITAEERKRGNHSIGDEELCHLDREGGGEKFSRKSEP